MLPLSVWPLDTDSFHTAGLPWDQSKRYHTSAVRPFYAEKHFNTQLHHSLKSFTLSHIQGCWVVPILGLIQISFYEHLYTSFGVSIHFQISGINGQSCNCKALWEKAMAPHSSTLAWKIPWMEEPGRLQSMRSPRVGHDWATSLSLFTFTHWRRKWQPTPVFLPGESQGQGSLVGCRLWGRTE